MTRASAAPAGWKPHSRPMRRRTFVFMPSNWPLLIPCSNSVCPIWTHRFALTNWATGLSGACSPSDFPDQLLSEYSVPTQRPSSRCRDGCAGGDRLFPRASRCRSLADQAVERSAAHVGTKSVTAEDSLGCQRARLIGRVEACRALRTRVHVPFLAHWRNWDQTLVHKPNSSGRKRHWQPVCEM